MPTFTDRQGNKLTYADRDAVLDFANAVRVAGGANAIDALLPSQIGNSQKCLIANALNFGCEVTPMYASSDYADGSCKWLMLTPTADTARRIAEQLRCRTLWVTGSGSSVWDKKNHNVYRDGKRLAVVLPKRIGNAAHAFDDGADFTDLAHS